MRRDPEGIAFHSISGLKRPLNFHEICECAHLKFTVSSKQAYTHMPNAVSHASVGFTPAHLNYIPITNECLKALF